MGTSWLLRVVCTFLLVFYHPSISSAALCYMSGTVDRQIMIKQAGEVSGGWHLFLALHRIFRPRLLRRDGSAATLSQKDPGGSSICKLSEQKLVLETVRGEGIPKGSVHPVRETPLFRAPVVSLGSYQEIMMGAQVISD